MIFEYLLQTEEWWAFSSVWWVMWGILVIMGGDMATLMSDKNKWKQVAHPQGQWSTSTSNNGCKGVWDNVRWCQVRMCWAWCCNGWKLTKNGNCE